MTRPDSRVLQRFPASILASSILAFAATHGASAIAVAQPYVDDPAGVGCHQFLAATDLASRNYAAFADAGSAGGENVDYANPNVIEYNATGRSALKTAANVAMNASMTPGLEPEIASPMRRWSIHATKLLLLMRLRGGSQLLNNTVSDLNLDAQEARSQCAGHA